MRGEYVYAYPRPMVTVDAVVFGVYQKKLQVVLIKRKNPPGEGSWAFPGGFVEENEPLADAVTRELQEETGIHGIHLEQVYSFGDPGRDPRGWCISTAFLALIDPSQHVMEARDDAADVAWKAVDDLPALAFDHDEIINRALKKLRAAARFPGVGIQALPEVFSLDELRDLYQGVLGHEVDVLQLECDLCERKAMVPVEGLEDAHVYRFAPERLASF